MSRWVLLFLTAALATAFPARGARRAVLIAVNEYAGLQQLAYCGRDMQELRQRLMAAGFAAADVVLLHDRAEAGRLRPLKANIQRALDESIEASRVEDTLVVAFSGHGVHLDGSSYLCPLESRLADPQATMIPLDTLYRKLEGCRARQKVLLVDACRNDPRPGGERSPQKPSEAVDRFSTSLQRPPEGLLVLTSCRPGQVSVEDEDLRHGVFMYHILLGLEGEADRDGGNSDGRISLLELYDYASQRTKAHVARARNLVQTPSLRGEITGDFDLAATPPPRTDRLPSRFYRDFLQFSNMTALYRSASDPDAVTARNPKALEALRQAHGILFQKLYWWGADEAKASREECARAIAACDDALRLEPGNAFGHLMRGLAYRARGDFAQALADWQKIGLPLEVKVDIPYDEAYSASSRKHDLRTGDQVTGTVEQFDEVIIDAVEGGWVHVARIKQRYGVRRAEAESRRNHGWIEKKYLEVKTGEAQALPRSLSIWMLLNDNDNSTLGVKANRPETLKRLRQAREILRADAKTIIDVPHQPVSADKCDEAIAACNEALRVESDNGSAFALRGLAYRKKRDFVRALADFNKLGMPLPLNVRAEEGRRFDTVAQLVVEKQVTGTAQPYDTLQVTRVEGNWLWVERVEYLSSDDRKKGTVRGWIEASRVE